VRQQSNLQIEGSICIAMPSWQLPSGQLHLWPINRLQFCWKAQNHSIEDQRMEINPIHYKLSSPDAMPYTQQAPKHPTSALKRIETLEIHRNPKFNRFQLGSYSKSSQTPPNPQIKVLNLCNSMLSMSMATEGLDLYVKSMRC